MRALRLRLRLRLPCTDQTPLVAPPMNTRHATPQTMIAKRRHPKRRHSTQTTTPHGSRKASVGRLLLTSYQ